MTAAARVYLCLGLLAIATYVAIGGSDLLYELFGSIGSVAIVAGIALNRPARRLPWLLVAASQTAFAAGDILYFSVYGGSPAFPSAADAVYVAGDVLLVAGVLALVHRRGGLRQGLYAFADAAVLSGAVALVLWALFFGGVFGAGHGLARVISIAYPLLDLLILAVLVRVLLEQGRRSVSSSVLVAAMVALLLSDAWYVVPALTSHYEAGTWRDAGWLASYVGVAIAALHPSMRTFSRPTAEVVPARRVMYLGGSLVLVAVAGALQQAFQGHTDVYVLTAVAAAMAVFITYRIVGLVADVERTRRQAEESERRFRMVFEKAPIGISVGRDGIMTETNPALHRLLGYGADELARMHYTEVTHADDQDLREQRELDDSERDSFSVDKRYRAKDGRVIDAHVHVALDLEDGLGISLIEDVTERRHLEEQLRHAQKMEAIGKLAGGIAHDFNNLMTAVLGYSDLILARLDPDDVNREKIEGIREASVRASDLTRQLLAFSRRQMLQAADVDLREVVLRMDSLLRRLIGEDIVLETEFGEEPAVVRADPTQLEQVVMNLAVNARDAMPSGGVLSIAAYGDGAEATLTVGDTGSGMNAEIQRRIFEPFFTTKPVGAGSGLGLSTVDGIVGQSGGTVAVESTPGRGTRFTIRLPLAGREPLLPDVPATATLVD